MPVKKLYNLQIPKSLEYLEISRIVLADLHGVTRPSYYNITLTEKSTKNNDSIKISSNRSGNYPNNGHNILTSREGSSNINLDESLISGSSGNVTVREEENHLNGINRFITDNRKTREKYKILNRMKETVTTVKSNVLTEAVKCNRINISNDAVNLSKIYNQLLEDELNNTSKVDISPPKVCTNSTSSSNASDSIAVEGNPTILSSQNEEIFSILEALQRKSKAFNNSNDRISGYFCSDTVLNLSEKVLTDIEIKVLEKALDYAPIQNKINELELRKDFEESCERMRLKWHFRNEPTPYFKETPVFAPKSTWKPPKGYPNLEVFLSQIEKELFELAEASFSYSNFCNEEWQAIRALANDRSKVIKKADKGSCVVVWDWNDYIPEAEK